MSNDQVKAKAQELKEGLAKETGVSVEGVEKLLERLGLESALENRLRAASGEGAERAGGLENVTLDTLRVAAAERQV